MTRVSSINNFKYHPLSASRVKCVGRIVRRIQKDFLIHLTQHNYINIEKKATVEAQIEGIDCNFPLAIPKQGNQHNTI